MLHLYFNPTDLPEKVPLNCLSNELKKQNFKQDDSFDFLSSVKQAILEGKLIAQVSFQDQTSVHYLLTEGRTLWEELQDQLLIPKKSFLIWLKERSQFHKKHKKQVFYETNGMERSVFKLLEAIRLIYYGTWAAREDKGLKWEGEFPSDKDIIQKINRYTTIAVRKAEVIPTIIRPVWARAEHHLQNLGISRETQWNKEDSNPSVPRVLDKLEKAHLLFWGENRQGNLNSANKVVAHYLRDELKEFHFSDKSIDVMVSLIRPESE